MTGSKLVNILFIQELVATFCDSASYGTSSTKALTPITLWIVTDATQSAGRELIRNALDYVRNSRLIRLSIIHNPAGPDFEAAERYATLLDAALSSNDLKLLDKLLNSDNAEQIMKGDKTAQDFNLQAAQRSSYGLELHRLIARKAMDFQPGQLGLVVNGRVVGPLDDSEEFTADDVALLEKHTMSSAGEKILQFVQDLPQLHSSDLVMRISGLLLSGAGGWNLTFRLTFYSKNNFSIVFRSCQDTSRD